MIRAAAKNHDDVAVVVEPQDYQAVLDELAANQGATTLTLRRRLAAKAYARTAAYDAAISNWFAVQLKTDAPDFRAFGGRLIQALRYGENPHQTAAFYRTPDKRPGVATARQLQGKELSYNNINDTDAAYECIAEFDPGAPLPASSSSTPIPAASPKAPISSRAYRKAFACDTQSPYGGIIAVNRTLDADAARVITEILTEVIIAPDATEEAIAIIAKRRNLRLLLAGSLPDPRAAGLTAKTVAGGLLVQSRDNAVVDDIDAQDRDQTRADRGRTARSEIRVPRRQARQIQHHRLCQGSRHRRNRRRADEPGRFRRASPRARRRMPPTSRS